MFAGTYTPTLDDKGRLFLPAKFREAMQEGLVITRGQDRCLEVRAQADFESFAAGLRESTDARMRGYNRMLFSQLSQQVPDKQGRINLNADLRSYAGLDRKCVVIGVSTKLEIWDPDSWASYTADQEEAFANLSEELFG